MIRVDINLAFVLPGIVGGSEEMSVRLIRAVLDDPFHDLDLGIIAGRRVFEAHPRLDAARTTRLCGPVNNRLYRIVAESAWLPHRTAGADLTHHFGGRLPARRSRPAVVFVHDIQPLDLAANFSPAKRTFLSFSLPRTVEQADLICTPTQWVADRLIERLGATPDRIRVVGPPVGRRPLSSERDEVGRRLEGRPVILYPAVTHPHKNHRTLLAAVQMLRRELPDVALVLTGGKGTAHGDVMNALHKLDPTGRTALHLGRVPERELGAWMARADVVAMPSVYEGFGLPVLEAMHAGTPVVAANAACLPEVVAGAGRLVEPRDPDAWAQTLLEVLTSPLLQAELAAAGSARAEQFGATAAAANLVAAWRDVAA